MHERSLVKSLLQQVSRISEENDAAEVAEVTVEIGPLSGVEIELVRTAFHELAHPMALTIVEVPLTVRCIRCDIVSEVSGFVFRCGECGSGQVKVVGGDEFRLVSITLTEGATHGH